MLFYTLSAICVAPLGLFTTGELTLPVTTCKRNSANYSACLKDALQEAWPRFVKGLPEFDFPPLDPIFYEHADYQLNSDDIIHGRVIISNITVLGFLKTQFLNIRTHFLDDVFRLEFDIQIPLAYGGGGMKLDGSISVFRIIREGIYNLSASDIRGTANITGHVINDTWVVEHFRIAPTIEAFKIDFQDVIEENKPINDVILGFVNEYWPALYRVILPYAVDIYGNHGCYNFPKNSSQRFGSQKYFLKSHILLVLLLLSYLLYANEVQI